MTPEDVLKHPAFAAANWYYSLELAPGVMTKGTAFRNLAITRELLRGVGVQGRRCLDVGIMEGLVTTLLERRGASKVVGYDRVARPGKLGLVRAALGSSYELVSGMKLADLPRALTDRGHKPFDVVVFSGVLYHMFDPLAGLALVRGMLRDGGVMIVESSVTFEDDPVARFNAKGRFYSGTNYWQLSSGCMDYLLRFLRLRPLDCAYLYAEKFRTTELKLGRLAIACRAIGEFQPEPDDQWMGTDHAKDLEEFLDWKAVASHEPEVPYATTRPGLVFRQDGKTLDVCATLRGTAEQEVTADHVCLKLDAKF